MSDEKKRPLEDSRELTPVDEKVEQVLDKYSGEYDFEKKQGGPGGDSRNRTSADTEFENEIHSNSFDAKNLQAVVDEIKVIEDGIKGLIAQRTKKIVEEKIPVEKERPAQLGSFQKMLVTLGLKEQSMETYTEYEVVRREVDRKPDEVMITEFRSMIDKYISSLKGLNDGLRTTVEEVDSIVKNLTDVSDTFTDQIHHDRRAYNDQVKRSREIEERLKEVIPLHESMSPLHDRFAEVEKLRDHLEMDLRDSQGMELKYKTNIDMGVKYQAALKSYRKLINDFKERGDLHVNMVDKFAQGAGHMKIAVDNVSQICSGVAKVTQSMIMIVESIEDGNRVLGRYASLIGDQITSTPQWQMEYNALKEAEVVYKKNDELRLVQIEDNRKEIENIIRAQ